MIALRRSSMEFPRLNGDKVANECQPMSALMWVGPSSRCISLMALNTGRSGQPVQKFGGRGGISATAATAPALGASMLFARATIWSALMAAGCPLSANAVAALLLPPAVVLPLLSNPAPARH